MTMKGRQLLVFSSLYISYTMYVYVRRSFAYVSPVLATEGNLNKSQLGLITSSQSIGYTISKFVCGILADIISPSLLLSSGLVLSGITAVCLTGFDSPLLLSIWWFMNGLSQGPGWPAIAVILKNWCTPDQFGTTWSIISTSMNLAGTVGPLATTLLVNSIGWKSCIQIAGSVSIVIGFISFTLVKNKPDQKTAGNTDSKNKNDETGSKKKVVEGNSDGTDNGKSDNEKTIISRKQVLFLPGFLGMCLCYMATALVQYGVLYWSQLYIVQERSHSLLVGSAFISSVDVGGIVGSFVAGYVSDHMIVKNPGIPRHLVRKIIVLYFLLFLTVVMYAFTYGVTANSTKVFITMVGFGIGVGVYGPIAIFGIVAMESVPSRMAGTSHAIAGLFSNCGIMAAGFPLSFVASVYNWQTTFLLQSTVVVVMVIYLIFKLRADLSPYKLSNFLISLG